MVKVFLVEDEFVVREGIKNNIDWKNEGFIFCGEASDGELAYPLIQANQPDIIITDIKMPFMDGLELSRLIKKELPNIKIIILSGHEEFKYAQEAIRIGVTEYLLKPICSSDLMKIVKKVGEQIKIEAIEKENLERYKREMEENEIDIKRRFFNEIISGSISTIKIIEKCKELGIELSTQYYQIVLFKYNICGDKNDLSKNLLIINKEFNKLNSMFKDIIVFDRAIEGFAILIKGETEVGLNETRDEYLNEVRLLMYRYSNVTYFGGVGVVVKRITSLFESFESASRAFSNRFVLDKSAIINCIEEIKNTSQEDIFDIGSIDIKKAEFFLRNGEIEELNFFIEDFLNEAISKERMSSLFRQYFIINIYLTVNNFLKEIASTEVFEDPILKMPNSLKDFTNDYDKMRQCIGDLFVFAITQRDIIRTKRYNRLIEQAKSYINENYSDENISLNEIAIYLNISPSHFSAVFSREVGKSFIKYLTDLRMKKSKELLKCTDMRCSDISSEVGYKDPHYFSYLFKKSNNCSPMQYRSLKKVKKGEE